MNINLSETRRSTLSVNQCVESFEQPFKDKFLTFKSIYQLNREAVNYLQENSGKYMVVAFSASWCKDCAKNISILTMLSDTVGLEVRIFGGLKKDPLSAVSKWRIAPSPSEVESFRVDKIPLIIVFDEEGEEVGRMLRRRNLRLPLNARSVKLLSADSDGHLINGVIGGYIRQIRPVLRSNLSEDSELRKRNRCHRENSHGVPPQKQEYNS